MGFIYRDWKGKKVKYSRNQGNILHSPPSPHLEDPLLALKALNKRQKEIEDNNRDQGTPLTHSKPQIDTADQCSKLTSLR